jgi:segregation and condensation protein B
MDANEKRRIIEALILASPEPISAARLADLIPYCTTAQAKDLVNELNTEYQEQDRSFEIWEVAGGYQIRTRAEFSGYLQKLRKTRALRLSRAALESLAIIAYKQPLTRAEVDGVRGVDTGPVVKSLLERRLVRIVGHREVPGRPMLYGTSKRFLEVFGLKSLKDLPALRELDDLAKEHGLGGGDVEGEGEDSGADAAEAEITELGEGEALRAEDVARDLGVREVDADALKPAPEPEPEQVVDLETPAAEAEGEGEEAAASVAEASGGAPESLEAAASAEGAARDGSDDGSAATGAEVAAEDDAEEGAATETRPH